MIVYLITNLVNGKYYVGQTAKSLKARWTEHLHTDRMYIARAIKKHGRENFVIEQLATAACQEQLDALEGLWIRLLASHVKGVGYNVRLLARGFTSAEKAAIGKKVAEHLRIHGHPNKGRVWPDSFVQKLRDLKGPKNARWGKHDTPEVCEKRRQKIIGKRYKQTVVRTTGGRNNGAGKRSDEVKARMRELRAPLLTEQLLRAAFTRAIKKRSGPMLVLQHATGNYL